MMYEVRWPGIPACDLDEAQYAIARELAAALLHRDTPELTADELLAALFAGSPAWGTLVVPGGRRGTYRLAGLPGA
jgi:hypothetical protein